ncbi:MAG: protein phosphatase 2C domain-containing protein [Oscillospiraceae bacterium]|jgi:serine/threonine protein phosphatase PrpC|nr:protein phosphatase 2C domain-containing protein [Oscillospiraceae bacterium]
MTYSYICKIGDREINEDAAVCLKRDGCYCFVVADGLGWHGGGEVASRILIETFEREFRSVDESNSAFLSRAFDIAQEEIASSKKKADEMKTTGVALSILGGRFCWAHVGDSRIYYFHKGKFRNRTLDHSVPQMLAISGAISDSEISHHPDRNKLFRALGDEWDNPRYEISKERRLSKGDAFLLCSDGFWEHIPEHMMIEKLRGSKSADEWLSAMRTDVEINASGHIMDNYTAITVMF